MVMKVLVVIVMMIIIMKIMITSSYRGGFVNSCYKIVSPVLLLEPNSNLAVCKHCSGTLLLVKNV